MKITVMPLAEWLPLLFVTDMIEPSWPHMRAAYRLSVVACICSSTSAAGSVISATTRLPYIDEAQNLGGSDLDILSALFASTINVNLVGDMRQPLSTNDRGPRHKKYRFGALIDWFRLREQRKHLAIEERPQTYRSNQIIADFSDTIFENVHQYRPTESRSDETHEHLGLFTVSTAKYRGHIAAYRDAFDPLCQRHGAASGKELDLPFVTFGQPRDELWSMFSSIQRPRSMHS